MFKLVIVFSAFVALSYQAALTKEDTEELDGFHDECLKITGADKGIVENARKGDFTDDAKLKEHLFCLAKKLGFQNDNGDIQKEKVKESVNYVLGDEKKTDELIAKCAVKKETPQETAYESFKCYYETTHVL